MRKCYLSLKNVPFIILLSTAFFLFALGANAQIDIPIGTGTTTNTGTTYPAPLQDYYEGSRAQFLYLASELTAAGMGPGNINSVKFNVTALNTFTGSIEQLTIKIGGTTVATLGTNTWEAVPNTVFGPVDYVPTLGVNTFTFTTPFFWNGTDNIVIETCNGAAAYTQNVSTSQTAGLTFNGSHTYHSDGLGSLCNTLTTTQNGGLQTARPNLTINWTTAASCSGTPNPGTVTPGSATICVGGSYTFTATGLTVASGLTYQWQISNSATGPWSPIAGANGTAYTSSLAANVFYRFKITCNNTDSAFSNVVSVATGNIASGLYTIDNLNPTNAALRTFNNFNDAYNFIKCGISAPVVFNVVNNPANPYSEQLIMNFVPGSSTTNTITFKGNGSTIGYSLGTTNQRATLKLDSASFITFDNLIINANAGTYGYGVQLRRNSDFNTIVHCTINSSTTVSTKNFAGIVINGTDSGYALTGRGGSDNNRIDSNTIYGGYYGIINVGSNNASSSGNGNNLFRDNIIRDFYQYGYYASLTYFNTIEHNTISRPARVSPIGPFYGIYFTDASASAVVARNKVINPFAAKADTTLAFYGINFDNVGVPSGSDFFVVNNLVVASNGNGLAYGISNNASPNITFIHNTVSLDYLGATTNLATRGFNQTGTAPNLVFYNNIVFLSRGGSGPKHGLYFGTVANAVTSDYNDVYLSSLNVNGNFGYYNGNRSTLQAWRGSSGQDANSFSTDPIFLSDYHPQSAVIDGKALALGLPLTAIDLDSAIRDVSNPDPGCYEYVPPACVAPPVAGTTTLLGQTIFTDTVCYGTIIPLSLLNNSSGFGQTYEWQISTDGVTYTPLDTPFTSPDYLLTATVTGYIRAAVKCGSGTTSTVYSNPMLLHVKQRLAAGSYTINSLLPTNYVNAPGANFHSFNDAKAAMGCGIDGAVVFNVQRGVNGVYDEQLRLGFIPYSSPAFTVTFNGNGYKISDSATIPAEKATVKLAGAKYITFNNLVIEARGTTEGFGVHLLKDADSNTFRQCHIITSTTATTNAYAGVVINGSEIGAIAPNNSNCDENLFDKDTITGGYYGIVAIDSASVIISNNKFTANMIEEFYNYGIYLGIGNSGTLVEGNRITRPTRASNNSSVSAIYATGASVNINLSKNRIYNLFGANNANTATQYGIQYVDADGTAGNFHSVTNNLIFKLTGAGPVYGISNSGTDYIHYYHNTVAIENMGASATGLSRGYSQANGPTGIQFKNNIVTITRDGNGAKHAIYIAGAPSDIDADHNDYFVSPTAAPNYIGFYTTNQLTLNDWQIATSGKDSNSFSIDPGYVNPAAENYTPVVAPLDNQGLPLGIGDDILGSIRNASTPDIGAFEFSVPPCSAPTAITATLLPTTGLCVGDTIRLNIPGSVSASGLHYIWMTSATGTVGSFSPISDSLDFPQYTTFALPTSYFQAKIICNGTVYFSSVVQANMNLLLAGGSYTIDKNFPTNYTGTPGANFTSYNDAVAAMACGILGSIEFNVSADTYTEQVRIRKVPGVGPQPNGQLFTVTFMAANGVAGTSILTNNSTVATSNFTLKLDSINYIRFRNLSIQSINTTNGRVVEFAGTSSYDSLVNCLITAPAATTAVTALAAVYANSFSGHDDAIVGNTIANGSSGIYLNGTNNTTLTADHLIQGNTINGAYNYGIYAGNTKRVKVNDNTVNGAAPTSATYYGIYATNSDSAYRVIGNTVNLNNTISTVYGIDILNCDAVVNDSGIVANNKIYALTGNTGNVYALACSTSTGCMVVNNVMAIDSAGTTSYGLYSFNSNNINYFNNSILNTDPSATAYAAYFNHSATANNVKIRNNIFAKKNKGKALYVNDATFFFADYNLLYATDTTLVQRGTNNLYSTLPKWRIASNWDVNSIVYPPQFVSDADLSPNISNPDVWAIHGRGVQIVGNSYDINNQPRPQTLTEGVPDLGAYEFFPTVDPTILNPLAAPAPNTTSTFMYGSDTVMKINWGATAPATITVKRYSGVLPPNVTQPEKMYFYNDVDITGAMPSGFKVNQWYIEPWLYNMPSENQIGLGRTTSSNAWLVGFQSRTDVFKNVISEANLDYLNLFTGLLNPYAPIIAPELDTSNRGRRFWVAYPVNELGGGQDMVLYLSAQEDATVQVKINGTNWVRNYFVPANTVTVTETLPKTGPDNAFIDVPGKSDRGISITSEIPIVAYAHVYGNTSSGASMLMPVGVWGYEYQTLMNTQEWGGDAFSYYYVIADHDNTRVQITSAPNVNLQNAGMLPNVPYIVDLNKGEFYQVVAQADDEELSSSIVRAIPNDLGKCYPVAVYSGSSRTRLPCPAGGGLSGGDFSMQQNFPQQAWGKRYLTAPSSGSDSARELETNLYRIAVRDPLTVVKKNGVVLTGLTNNYYEYSSNTGDYIEADQPIMVAQYLTGPCTGEGDPEMIYISPVEQGIKQIGFYRNTQETINTNYLTLIIPTNGLASFQMFEGVTNVPSNASYIYPHPFNGNPALRGVNYSIVIKRWTSAQQQVRVQSDSAFTAITYGLGSYESYGYNAGTLVKNLIAQTIIRIDTAGPVSKYTCAKTPFQLSVILPLPADTVCLKFSQVPYFYYYSLTDTSKIPVRDTCIYNPVYDSTYINGQLYYQLNLGFLVYFDGPGTPGIPLSYHHPLIESCDKVREEVLYIPVLPSPKTDFNIIFSGCAGSTAQFIADSLTENGLVINNWLWTFHDTSQDTGALSSFTYNNPGIFNVRLQTRTPDGCIGDTTRQVIVNIRQGIALVDSSLTVCSGSDTSFQILNPSLGATYYWYTSPTGGNPVDSGITFTLTGITAPATYYVGGINIACGDTGRTMLTVNVLPQLPAPSVAVDSVGPDFIDFIWPAITGATGYEVSIDTGFNWTSPSSGATGLTHHVGNLAPTQSVCIIVRALGATPCENSLPSAPVCAQVGCPNVAVQVVNNAILSCPGNPVTFEVQAPVAGYTYDWYDSALGVIPVASGITYTLTATNTDTFYVGGTSGGCSATRTQVIVTVLTQLPAPFVTVDSVGATCVYFSWPAVTGAIGYQYSTDGGVTFNPPVPIAGTTYADCGHSPLDTVTIIIKAVGDSACQNNVSIATTGVTVCTAFTVSVVQTTLSACSGGNDTFRVQPPYSGIYNWYDAATGGNLLFTGPNFPVIITSTTDYWVEQVFSGCVSSRTHVTAVLVNQLATPVVSVGTTTSSSVAFNWPAVAGATSYEVTYAIGVSAPVTVISPTNSYTVTGMNPQESVTISVRALGAAACQSSNPGTQTGQSSCNTAVIQAVDSVVTRCSGDHFVFNIQTVGNTYQWFADATTTTSFYTGQSLDTVLTTTTSFYVEGVTTAGCRSARIKVRGVALQLLAAPDVKLVDSTPTSLTFTWQPVSGASGYEVWVANISTTWQPWNTTTYSISPLTPLQIRTIYVRAVGGNGCQTSMADTATGKTTSDQVYIPNTFTPNGDGHNDLMRVYSFNNVIREMKVMIFNQWGEKVFETTNPQRGWDGKFKGKAQPAGVYIYVGRFTLTNGNVLDKKGSINLVR